MNIEIATEWASENGMLTLTKKLNNEDNISKLLYKISFNDAVNLSTKLMTRKQCIELAVFAAEQVLHLFETAHPNDRRPRKAIEAAKKVLEEDTAANRYAAANAVANVYTAYTAAADAYIIYNDDAAANATYAAAINTANAAYAATNAIYAYASAVGAARAANIKAAIINKCIEILGRMESNNEYRIR